MSEHEWTDGIVRCRIVPSDAPGRHKIQEWIVPGSFKGVDLAGYWEDMEDPEYYGAAEEILRLAAENAELKAERDEAIAHAVGMSQEITALHEGERRRQIELLELVRDGAIQALSYIDQTPEEREGAALSLINAQLDNLLERKGFGC